MAFANRIEAALEEAGVRVKLDARDQYTPGWKYNEWELRGVPLRIEIGPRDVAKDSVVVVRRDTREKAFVPAAEVTQRVTSLLDVVQAALFERALDFRTENTRSAELTPRWSIACTLVSWRSGGMIATIEVISTVKPPAVRRPAAASRAARISSTAMPIAPSTCTNSDSDPRVTSTFSASCMFFFVWSA